MFAVGGGGPCNLVSLLLLCVRHWAVADAAWMEEVSLCLGFLVLLGESEGNTFSRVE